MPVAARDHQPCSDARRKSGQAKSNSKRSDSRAERTGSTRGRVCSIAVLQRSLCDAVSCLLGLARSPLHRRSALQGSPLTHGFRQVGGAACGTRAFQPPRQTFPSHARTLISHTRNSGRIRSSNAGDRPSDSTDEKLGVSSTWLRTSTSNPTRFRKAVRSSLSSKAEAST